LNICYRCGEKIVDVARFSVEHKKGWRFAENPRETFFDLNNITFSHLDCNSGVGERHKKYKNDYDREKAYRLRLMERRGPEIREYHRKWNHANKNKNSEMAESGLKRRS
ncbi:unnamed protein product, partial [marine sediment metagenome]